MRPLLLAAVLIACPLLTGCDRSPSGTYPVGARSVDPGSTGRKNVDQAPPSRVVGVRSQDSSFEAALAPGRGAPTFLLGRWPSSAATPVAAALEYLDVHRRLLQLDDPAASVRLNTVTVDGLGGADVRLHQVAGGFPVCDGVLLVHVDADGVVTAFGGRTARATSPIALPRLSAGEALATILRWLRVEGVVPTAIEAAEPPTYELCVRAATPWDTTGGGEARLVYRFDLFLDLLLDAFETAPPVRLLAEVDTESGALLEARDLLAAAVVPVEGSGRGVRGSVRSLEVSRSGSDYLLRDQVRAKGSLRTFSAAGGTRLPGLLVRSRRPDRWDEGGAFAGAAVDAHYHAAVVYDYYLQVHGRDSLGGDGERIDTSVHYGEGVSNAFWTGRQLVFGDGDGVEMLPLSVALDVVAHEMSHAVIERSAGMLGDGESGALGESLADALGCLVEHQQRPRAANWLIGEEVLLHRRPGDALRDLAEPGRFGQPDHLSGYVSTFEDSGGVHLNSGIPGNAWYLLAEGGENPTSREHVDGIGTDAAGQVIYRVVAHYLTASSSFADAALATVAAASDLFGRGSREVRSARAAWAAVGVLPP